MKINITDRVTVRISGGGCEKFLNLCQKNNIVLLNIKSDNYGIVCSISSGDFKHIRSCVRKSKVHMSIIHKSGLGLYLKHRRKRYAFFCSALLTFAAMIYLTSCIWVIDVVGNEKTSTDVIVSSLEKHGMKIGALRFGHDIKSLQNEVLVDIDSLSWLWVNIDGTRATVEVREKGDYPQFEDKSGVYNLVASHNGYVTDIIAKSGRKVIERGSVVSEGDLLVSGVSTTNFRGNRYIHSDGAVIARTWRKKCGEYHHTKTEYFKTGKKIKKKTVNLFGFDVKLYLSNKIKYRFYKKEHKTDQLKIFGNIYLPVRFTTDTFCEIIRKDTHISDAQAVSAAVDRLSYEIEKERSDNSHTIKREYEYCKLENGNVFVTVTVESEENIAKPVKIDVEKTEEKSVGEDT